MASQLLAGAATCDITPINSQFLYGYPHVERYSTGVHDPLLASALYLSDGRQSVIFVASDTLFIGKGTAQRTRAAISQATGVPAAHIMVTATHTHSAPLATEYSRREIETDAPDPDPAYLAHFEQGIISAAVAAYQQREPAKAGLAVADAAGIGTHRHDPRGPSDLQVPVLGLRSAGRDAYLAAMLVCSMHPTVLHEDSRLVSGDFPAMARKRLQETLLGAGCPVLHHTGPAGNQSPRHVTRGNTFAEAERIGGILADAVSRVVPALHYTQELPISAAQKLLDLPQREFSPVEEARAKLHAAEQRLRDLRASAAPRTDVRSAECDWFGAEEALALSEAAVAGKLAEARRACMPAEVQLIRLGDWSFVGWPCEAFVEFSLAVKSRHPNTFVISLANGELRGYLVTEEAVRKNWYEAGNALMKSPESGELLVAASQELLNATP